jgi:ribonucleotide reductase class II
MMDHSHDGLQYRRNSRTKIYKWIFLKSAIVWLLKWVGTVPEADRVETTEIKFNGNAVEIIAGMAVIVRVEFLSAICLKLSTDDGFTGDVTITIDLGNIQPAGEKLKGLGCKSG